LVRTQQGSPFYRTISTLYMSSQAHTGNRRLHKYRTGTADSLDILSLTASFRRLRRPEFRPSGGARPIYHKPLRLTVTRQTMRFVPINSREQQAALSLHRVRQLLIKQRTQLVNLMRSVLAELGTAIPVGIVKALQMAREIADGESELDLPSEAANVVAMLAGQLLQLHAQLRKLDLR